MHLDQGISYTLTLTDSPPWPDDLEQPALGVTLAPPLATPSPLFINFDPIPLEAVRLTPLIRAPPHRC